MENERLKVNTSGTSYFRISNLSDEAEETMLNYLMEREQIIACEGHDAALFLSSQKKRISIRAVEKSIH